MKELYAKNRDFREYVTRYCKSNGVSVEEALEHALVKEVGKQKESEVSDVTENTRITTVRITEIIKDSDDAIQASMTEEAKQTYKDNLRKNLKEMLNVDDVTVDEIQDFTLELKE